MVRKGELMVPGSFEEFAALLEEAVAQPLLAVTKENHAKIDCAPSTAKSDGVTSECHLRALAEALWERLHGFSSSVAPLRQLLEATLVWQPNRFLPMWLKLLPVEYAWHVVNSFQRTHGPGREEIAWGYDESANPGRDRKPRPAVAPCSEAEGRQQHAGELQRALRIWFVAVWHALLPVMRSTYKVTVALYDWAVSRFGIREEFVAWRPELSVAQLQTRQDRPEWATRVVTVTGKTLVKLQDGRMFEPDKGPGARC